MAIAPESLDTTSSSEDSNRRNGRSSLRRRLTNRVAAKDLPESDSNSLEAESLGNGGENDGNETDLIGNVCERASESADEMRTTESGSEGSSFGNENEDAVKKNGGSSNDREVEKFHYRASAPAHRKIMESPLSSDAIFKQSHGGLFNLCIVVLVAVNSRLIIENLMKYGWLIDSGFWFSPKSLGDWPLLMCCLSLPIFPLAAFLVEKLVQQKYISEFLKVLMDYKYMVKALTCGCTLKDCDHWIFFYHTLKMVVIFAHVAISTVELVYPVLVILRCDSAVLSGVTLMFFSCIVWLKLVSYAHTNYDLRVLEKSKDKWEALSNYWSVDYSYDVTFKSLVYFMIAPTLCYQPTYPRAACIRKGWVVRQCVKLVIFTGLMGFIVEQYINPIVKNSQHPLKGNLLYAIERVLKLSVPNLYVWLCMFYCFFHLWLNILAELLCFGDREFYKDWWNARTVEEYWRMWNMPVHKWMVRHIYFPCLRNGIPKAVAVLVAFLVSALFHELCIAVPCHIFKFWAFSGIMLQVPLVIVTNFLQNKFQNSMVGNIIFWCFFSIFGQPMCLLLYYHDLMNRKASAR